MNNENKTLEKMFYGITEATDKYMKEELVGNLEYFLRDPDEFTKVSKMYNNLYGPSVIFMEEFCKKMDRIEALLTELEKKLL